MEVFQALKLPPGLRKAGTTYQAKGRWIDANLVRWYQGILGPVGGWIPLAGTGTTSLTFDSTLVTFDSTLFTFDLQGPLPGVPRTAHAWTGDDAAAWMGIGTVGTGTTKLWAYSDGLLFDVTPAGLVDAHEDAYNPAGAYGRGPYGFGPYGEGITGTSLTPADTWQMDNFGEWLLAVCTSNDTLYVWEKNPFAVAQVVAGAPSCLGVVVTPERFIFALGANGVARSVAWPSQESTTDWTPTDANTAGDFPLQTAGSLVSGRASRRETLLWTNIDLHSASFIGGELVYGFVRIGDNCGLMGPQAVAMANGMAFWMSPKRRFFRYDGAVTPLECELFDFLDGDMDMDEANKVQAVAITEFNEVWWFYPSVSQGGTENGAYVCYNYAEDHWTKGLIGRSCAVPADVFGFPIMGDAAGMLWQHETGNVRNPTPFVESGPIEIAQGDQLAVLQRMIPDSLNLGDATVEFFLANYPTDAETTLGPFSMSQPQTLRATARQLRLRITEARAVDWRVGDFRLGLMAGSRR